MRKLRFAVMALITAVVLSSCGFLPFGPGGIMHDNDNQQGDARMEQIADAVNNQNAAALRELFSARALEQATDLDQRLDYFLWFFPNGGLTWEQDRVGSEARVDASGKSVSSPRRVASGSGHGSVKTLIRSVYWMIWQRWGHLSSAPPHIWLPLTPVTVDWLRSSPALCFALRTTGSFDMKPVGSDDA